jgi:hypothetical protein
VREDVGEFLVQQGVKLSPVLGLSETGGLTTSIPSELYFSVFILYLLILR